MTYGWVASAVGSVVFFVHYVATFMSWSLQPGNVAAPRPGGVLQGLWPVLSFPLFTVLPGSFINLNWSITLFFNSAIWAGAAYAAVSVLSVRRRR